MAGPAPAEAPHLSGTELPFRRLRRPRFILLPVAAVLLPLFILCVGGWLAWKSVLDETHVQLTRKADASAEYASRVLAGYVVADGRLNDLLKGLTDQEIRNREAEFHADLRQLVTELPQAAASFVIDRDGYALVSGSIYPVSHQQRFTDRDYFQALQDDPRLPLYVSRIDVGRLDGNLYFAVSRRRSGSGNGLPPGAFDGVVLVSVNPSLISAGLKHLLDDDGDVITLIRSDGQVLSRSFGVVGPFPSVPAKSAFFTIAASPGGTGSYRSVSTIDGVARLAAMRPVDGFPVFAVASRSFADMVSDWYDRMSVHLIFGVPATLALLLLSLRVRNSQLKLAAENRDLEQALEESDARLRKVQTAGGALTAEISPDGTVTCNNEFRALWGVPPNAPVDLTGLLQKVHPDDQAAFLAAYRELGQTGTGFNLEFRVLVPANEQRWMLMLGEGVAGRNRRPARFVGVVMDITERKRIEVAMRERENRLQDLVATLDLATVMVRGLDGTIHFWSEGCTRLFGWTPEEAVGQRTHDLLRTETQVPTEEIEAELLSTGEWSGDFRQFHRDGTGMIVATRKILRRDDMGNPSVIMATAADVTALRGAQEELEQLNRQLENLVHEEVAKREAAQQRAAHAERIQALGQLAGGIAHDLNNVLQAITSGASLATRDADNPDRVRRLARLMNESAQRGAAVTRRLLSFSRRADLRAEPIDPRAMLTDLREVLAHTLGDHVQCTVEAPAGLPRLLADRSQLETALVNLATNARDAMPGGGIIVMSATTETVLDQITHPAMAAPGRFIRLTVTDTGSGMDPATLARVPEPFFTTKREGSGTGLGLAMVNGFAQQSGGALGIESTLGVGTTVSLWLPEVPDQAAVRIRPSQSGTSDPTRPVRLLMVDDDASVLDIMVEQLRATGYSVTIALSGRQALDLLDGELEVDVLICDLSMPGLGGMATIREAQAKRTDLPAILLTGYFGDQSALPADGATFTLLRKPATLTELADSIAFLLAAGDRPDATSNPGEP